MFSLFIYLIKMQDIILQKTNVLPKVRKISLTFGGTFIIVNIYE